MIVTIRKKILIYFSVLAITLTGGSFLLVYSVFSDFRMEEYQERLRQEIETTIKYLAEIKEIDHSILKSIDKYSINNLYTEKVILYDAEKKHIYSGIDDTQLGYQGEILKKLSASTPLIETNEDEFDVVGAYINFKGNAYYGIAKAYDLHGYSKLHFLRNIQSIFRLCFH